MAHKCRINPSVFGPWQAVLYMRLFLFWFFSKEFSKCRTAFRAERFKNVGSTEIRATASSVYCSIVVFIKGWRTCKHIRFIINTHQTSICTHFQKRGCFPLKLETKPGQKRSVLSKPCFYWLTSSASGRIYQCWGEIANTPCHILIIFRDLQNPRPITFVCLWVRKQIGIYERF